MPVKQALAVRALERAERYARLRRTERMNRRQLETPRRNRNEHAGGGGAGRPILYGRSSSRYNLAFGQTSFSGPLIFSHVLINSRFAR